jgi:hypothetical protein
LKGSDRSILIKDGFVPAAMPREQQSA